MSNLAIILARGGSKRVPRKNIRDFLGKPIIAYSIEAAFKSDLFEEVMVSTEDEEIACVAKKYGANIPFMRSHENAMDFTPTIEVIKEVIGNYKSRLNKSYNYICCIYPTAPLINSEDLIDGLVTLKEKKYKVVFPVIPFSYPIWRGLERDKDGLSKMIWPENINRRSQDLKVVYHDAGMWYWLNSMNMDEGFYTDNTGTIILDEMNVQDIDNLNDWRLSELKYRLMYET